MKTRPTIGIAILAGGLTLVTSLTGQAATKAPKVGGRCVPKEVGKTVAGAGGARVTCVQEGANKRRWKVAAPTTTAAPVTTTAAGTPTVATTASGPNPAGTSKEPIKIGVALGQTGATTANLAQDQTIAAKLAEKYFNDKGGANGRPIKLVFQDTGPNPDGAINAFNTLIDSDKVVAIMGPTLSAQAFASDPIADRAKVPVIAPSNTAAGIPQIGDYVARVSAGVAAYAGNTVKYAQTLTPMTKAAVFFAQDDAFSRSETTVFQAAVKSAGLELLPPQTFLVNDTDFTQQVQYVQTNKPDLVAISGLATSGNLVKQLRDTGFRGIIIGGNGLNVAQTFTVCKQQCDGLIVAQAYSPDIPAGGINADFNKIFLAEQKRDPGQIAAQSFTGIQVLVEALTELDKAGKLAGSLDSIRQALNTQILAGKYSTPLGEITFDKEGEINQKSFYVAQIRMIRGEVSDVFSGKFTYVKF